MIKIAAAVLLLVLSGAASALDFKSICPCNDVPYCKLVGKGRQ